MGMQTITSERLRVRGAEFHNNIECHIEIARNFDFTLEVIGVDRAKLRYLAI